VPAGGAIHLAPASGASLGAAGAGKAHANAATTAGKVQQTLIQHLDTRFQQPSIVGISFKCIGCASRRIFASAREILRKRCNPKRFPTVYAHTVSDWSNRGEQTIRVAE
jgi:hypothetical protein